MATKRAKKPPAMHHSVYVIELDRAVLKVRAFKKANPDNRADKPCLYVGKTGHTPEHRFEQHLAGIKSAKYVRKYGLRLRPQLYARFNPMLSEAAEKMEGELARRLRKRGFAVWQK